MKRHAWITAALVATAGCGVAPPVTTGATAPVERGYAIAALAGDAPLEVAARAAAIGYGPSADNYLAFANASPLNSSQISFALGESVATPVVDPAPVAEPESVEPLERRDLPRAYMKDLEAHLVRRQRPARYWVQAIAEPLAVGTVMDFNVDVGEYPEYQNQVVTAELIASGPHAYFFVDRAAMTTALRERVARFSAAFESDIYVNLTRVFGAVPNPGVDNQAPIFFLITPAVDRVLGYFHPRDQFAPGPEAPPVLVDSNLKDMLYISSRHAREDLEVDVLGTITHELQHLIHFDQKYPKTGQVEETWIDEGLSTLAEDLGGFGMRHGASVPYSWIAGFQADPSQVSLTDWEGNADNSDYGAVLLFMSYLMDRFGQGVITELATNEGVGVENVDAALRKRGTTFRDFFYDWAMANVLDGKPSMKAWRYQYRHFEMTGQTGPFTLHGFKTHALGLEGEESLALRPTTMRFYRLPAGARQPGVTFQPTQDAYQLPFLQIW